MFISDNITATV